MSKLCKATIYIIIILYITLTAEAFPPSEPYDPKSLMEKAAIRISEKGEFTFAVTGGFKDGGKACPGLLVYLDKVVKPDFVITLGDLVWYGPDVKNGVHKFDTLEQYSGWFFRKYPVWPANGDQEGTYNFLKFFNLPSENYTMELLNTKFVFVGYWPHPPKKNWLRKRFEDAKRKNQHIFLCGQRVYFSPYYKHYIKQGPPREAVDLYSKYNVTAVFGADNYLYYRTNRKGVNYFVAAGGGPGPGKLTWPERVLPDDAYWKDSSYEHYAVVITVNGDNVYGKTVTKSGAIIDRFELARK